MSVENIHSSRGVAAVNDTRNVNLACTWRRNIVSVIDIPNKKKKKKKKTKFMQAYLGKSSPD